MKLHPPCLALSLFLLAPAAFAETEYALETLELANIRQDVGDARMSRSVEGQPLRIGSRSFAHGLGGHANSAIRVDLNGGGLRFRALVGVDAGVGPGRGSVNFRVFDGTRLLWESGLQRGGDEAQAVDVDLTGIQQLMLLADDTGDGTDADHANWAEAVVVMATGTPSIVSAPREPATVLTPPPPATPRINGPRVYGVRPGHPVLFRIPATGARPLTLAAEDLPDGLHLDPTSGILTGSVAQAGRHVVTLIARNAKGETRRALRLEIGERIALTPPMGWNSWNCFAHTVTAQHIRDAADHLITSGLADHGWSYINLDDFWTTRDGSKDATLQGPARDAQGRILPNARFPDLPGLIAHVHGLGLKFGLYSSPGPTTCGGCVGSYQHEEQDAATYAAWGVDFLKYDWCSYGHTVEVKTRADHQLPYQRMRDALRRHPRDIVYSLCQYGVDEVWTWGDEVGGNCWRTTADIEDTWTSMATIGFSQISQAAYAGPGRWNDPDMLVIGKLGWGPRLRPTRLTPSEQYTHVSLWCLLAAPLLIGCDLAQLDDFTRGLLTNDEVIEVNQDPLGRQAARAAKKGQTEVWVKAMEDGSHAVGLFNRSEIPTPVTYTWADEGGAATRSVRDLWRQQDVGSFTNSFTAEVPRHGCVLVRMRANP